jgi:hypothetical protein
MAVPARGDAPRASRRICTSATYGSAHSGDFGPHGEIVSPSVLKATVTLGQALVGLGYAIAASGELRAPEPQL